MFLAQLFVYMVFIFIAVGVLFAIYFSFFAVKRFDESAKDSGIFFRVIIFFGVVAFWPLLTVRMLRGQGQPVEKNMHRETAKERSIND